MEKSLWQKTIFFEQKNWKFNTPSEKKPIIFDRKLTFFKETHFFKWTLLFEETALMKKNLHEKWIQKKLFQSTNHSKNSFLKQTTVFLWQKPFWNENKFWKIRTLCLGEKHLNKKPSQEEKHKPFEKKKNIWNWKTFGNKKKKIFDFFFEKKLSKKSTLEKKNTMWNEITPFEIKTHHNFKKKKLKKKPCKKHKTSCKKQKQKHAEDVHRVDANRR